MGNRFLVEGIEKIKATPNKNEEYRNSFQKDRDKILYSKAFRRLAGKTQVFLSDNDDHIRTRLTHTLEVAQIAKTISEALGFDVNLTEAIALGHDIGHAPFGHVGERILNEIMNGCYLIGRNDEETEIDINPECRGFKHNLQGVRVLKKLEETELKISEETLNGIAMHSSLNYEKCKNYLEEGCKCTSPKRKGKCTLNGKTSVAFYNIDRLRKNWSFEGFIVAISDEIAQRHHDIEDALEFKIIKRDEFKKDFLEIFKLDNGKSFFEKEISNKEIASTIIEEFIEDVIKTSKEHLESFIKTAKINSQEDFQNRKQEFLQAGEMKYIRNIISFSDERKEIDKRLKQYLKNKVLLSFEAQRMDGKGKYIIRNIFKAYLENPQQLPDKTIKSFYKLYLGNDYLEVRKPTIGDLRGKLQEDHAKKCEIDKGYRGNLMRVICDYISGMTDEYAMKEYKKLYN